MTEHHTASYEEGWGTYGALEWTDAMLTSMKLGGVDNLFFVSGSELAFFQEGVARAGERGWPAPRLFTVTHEGVALHAALGYTMASGQPAATAVHVDVGTLNYGAAIHTAWRGGYPVLMMAGTGPRAYPGSMPGARDAGIQWVQEPRDQGEILRQYTKLDHRLEHQDNPGLMVSRALQVAMSEPKGPVYLTVPRETAMLPMPGDTRFPTRDQLGIARPAWPDPADARQVAAWLIKADNPGIYLAKSGRNADSVAAIVQLAELLALPVMETGTDRLNFPTTHPLYGTGPAPQDADVALIVESPSAYIPPKESPRADAKIVWVDDDPVYSRYKTMERRADMWLPVSAVGAARAIHHAATGMLGQSDMSRIADRRARLAEQKVKMRDAAEAQGKQAGQRQLLHPRWVAYQLGKLLEPDAILLDDALSNTPFVQAYHGRAQPGTYFKSGGSTGGWGSGAAFGAKLARPGRDVVLASGDGYFMFGTPLAALWAAHHYKAPFLAVVFVNRSYSTGTRSLANMYPDGAAVRTGNSEGGLFDPPPDFAKLAEAANGYGESVAEPKEVAAALKRGLAQVR
ncbi:MAG: thiamine pyrophosphate-requiring protein, partial [Candidatus Tectomicrobia bacterium]